MHKIDIKTTIKLSDQDINDLMVSALEGGINYWCNNLEILYSDKIQFTNDTLASDVIALGGELKLYDIESDDTWILDINKFMNGVKMYCKNNKIFDGVELIENHDADTADNIIQFALFNEIVFC
jgi:hypothetical protein